MVLPRTSLNRAPSIEAMASDEAINKGASLLLSNQMAEGYWWYTLEANESINAEYIFLLHYLGIDDNATKQAVARRIESKQNKDGSWSIYHDGPGDLSTSIECYFALKLCGTDSSSLPMTRAKRFILAHGGLVNCRVFTRIHLALFGLVPWEACPVMPVSFIHLPSWAPLNIYEFSSWARATIVPLLIILHQKRIQRIDPHFLDELYKEKNPKETDWKINATAGFFSTEQFFIFIDRFLKWNPLSLKISTKSALRKCEEWIRTHLEKTEDIYPAMAYGAMALSALGYGLDDPMIRKALGALKRFQIDGSMVRQAHHRLGSPCPGRGGSKTRPYIKNGHPEPVEGSTLVSPESTYQQCCISPVWDTPWAGLALLESGVPADDPNLLKAGRWLINKQITDVRGDWAQKNRNGKPGGWSFEFQNDFFPDVDDTIAVMMFLKKLQWSPSPSPPPIKGGGSSILPSPLAGEGQGEGGIQQALNLGLQWLLSMQSKSGGWAAFDVNNTKEIVNKIPFSDHGACLDPPTPDITGRMIELLALMSPSPSPPPVKGGGSSILPSPLAGEGQGEGGNRSAINSAIRFLEKTQEKFGAWEGRWGVNYIYGTWCVLRGLAACQYPLNSAVVRNAVFWLKSVQREDGGFGESCDSYRAKKYVGLPCSTPSQTAWALMGLIAGGQAGSDEAHRAAEFLVNSQKLEGGWDELYHTGTGFPGHFYIRYHGYRHYFPLLALSLFEKNHS